MDLEQPTRTGINLIRATILVNFLILLVLVGPGSSHEVDLVLRRAGVASLVTLVLQLWFVGSTLLVTLLFVWRLRKSATPGSKLPKLAKLDWILLLSWWCVAILLCMYAFMMGMGG
jgi:amino acid transporter